MNAATATSLRFAQTATIPTATVAIIRIATQSLLEGSARGMTTAARHVVRITTVTDHATQKTMTERSAGAVPETQPATEGQSVFRSAPAMQTSP